jgi:hypothetical protein
MRATNRTRKSADSALCTLVYDDKGPSSYVTGKLAYILYFIRKLGLCCCHISVRRLKQTAYGLMLRKCCVEVLHLQQSCIFKFIYCILFFSPLLVSFVCLFLAVSISHFLPFFLLLFKLIHFYDFLPSLLLCFCFCFLYVSFFFVIYLFTSFPSLILLSLFFRLFLLPGNIVSFFLPHSLFPSPILLVMCSFAFLLPVQSTIP